MHVRLFLAIFVSTFIIGGSLWYRSTITYENQPQLIAEAHSGRVSEEYQKLLTEQLATTTKSGTSPEEATMTRVISQQLLVDYVNLATKGQATEANIVDLANRYVESIPTINKVPTIGQVSLKIVSDSKVNMQAYADEVTNAHKIYSAEINKAYNSTSVEGTLDESLYSLTDTLGKSHEDVAERLKKVQTPRTLAAFHLELINNYISIAYAMKSISSTEKDPASAFAGLALVGNNIGKTNTILEKIGKVLTDNGVAI